MERRGHLGNLADTRIELANTVNVEMSGGSEENCSPESTLPNRLRADHSSAGVWRLGYLSGT